MTVGQKSSISARDGWAEHIRREIEAFEQRELKFLAREREDRLRELANWLQVDLAAMSSENPQRYAKACASPRVVGKRLG
jgi:hypothetical protein